MKKLLFGIFACICAFVMTSCAGNTPSAKAEAYLNDLKDGDYKSMVEHLHFKKAVTDEDKAKLVAMMEEKGQKSIEKDGPIEKIEITSENISEDGTSATVGYTLTHSNGTTSSETVKLVTVDGKWLVDAGK